MFEEMREYILPVALFFASVVIGVIFEKIVLRKLHKIAEKTKWEGDDIIITSLRRWLTFWFSLIGLHIAISTTKISPVLLNYLHKIILILYILSFTIVLSKISVGFINIYSKRAQDVLPSTSLFANLARIVVFTIGILVILHSLGISITPVLTALGVGGLAVALALQDTLSNLFAGLHIILTRQIKPGDYIRLESGEEGYVVDITWRNTTIRELPNNYIIIPNSKLAQAIVKNYFMPEKEMSIPVQVGVSYDSDLEKVERVTLEVAREVMREVPGGVPTFEPVIRYHTFGDFSINFTVVLRCKEFQEQYAVRHEFIKRLHKRYREEGIIIPFPIRTVYINKGNEG
ncbi:MAG: mechanosensitive ion channel family protein [Candidatus Kryptonium sp.]|nr:mechanosensitive ion channel family protein [Candidatus Kryptonium sp.]